MDKKDDYALVADWLQQRGHSTEEIFKILEQVRKYEQETQLDSIMDSIGAGRLDMDALIKEALAE